MTQSQASLAAENGRFRIEDFAERAIAKQLEGLVQLGDSLVLRAYWDQQAGTQDLLTTP